MLSKFTLRGGGGTTKKDHPSAGPTPTSPNSSFREMQTPSGPAPAPAAKKDEDDFEEIDDFSDSDDDHPKKSPHQHQAHHKGGGGGGGVKSPGPPTAKISLGGAFKEPPRGVGGDDESDDVVGSNVARRNPMGILAARNQRKGSEGSSNSDDSSHDDSDHSQVEDLFSSNPADEEEEDLDTMTMSRDMNAGGPPRLPVDVLREVPFFAQFSAMHQETLFKELEEEMFEDGQNIVTQGEVGDRFYVIIEGEALVSKVLENGEVADLTHIYSGDFFGELVLIYGGERVASVTSVGRTKCMSLSRKSFEKYDEIRYFLILQKVPLLAGLSREHQLRIVQRLKPAKFSKDEFVVKQGDRGDAFFMITKGSAVVVEDSDKIITRLYEGHSFGEMALLSDEPRVASVKAATELNLMYLPAEDFKELLTAEDFSRLLELENKKIRELRDRRQGKRGGSVVTRDAAGTPSNTNRPINTPSDRVTATDKRLRSASTNVQTQQKLKTGKTSGGAKVVNGYILLDQIGKGTFGVVRLCEHQDTHEKFAIKIIDKSLFSSKVKSKHQTSLEDMRREAAIMKKLNHENVVNLIDVIDDPRADQLYLVQEYCALGAIMSALEGNQPLPEPTARKYFRDLLCGIDYLHAHFIIHRDIKPMNLLLTADHVVKIGDFGAARVLGGDQAAVGIAGTPAFMAPELLSQDVALYNGPAVDLWSCGATLFMLTTGVPPWMADDEIVLAKKVRDDELVFPGAWGTTLSPHLRNLLTRLLVKDPSARMTLTQTMEHEWVTEEGADPMPRFVDIQPQLMRVNSSLTASLTAAEKRDAISIAETVGGDTPLQSGRKTAVESGHHHHHHHQQLPTIPSSSTTMSTPPGSFKSGGSQQAMNKSPSAQNANAPATSTHKSGGSTGKRNPSSTRPSPLRGPSNPNNYAEGFGDGIVSVEDSDFDSEFEPITPRPGSDSIDYTQWDVGKKKEDETRPSLQRQTSTTSSASKAKKKMSVVEAFMKRGTSQKARHRSGSKSSLPDSPTAAGGKRGSKVSSPQLVDGAMSPQQQQQPAAARSGRPLSSRAFAGLRQLSSLGSNASNTSAMDQSQSSMASSAINLTKVSGNADDSDDDDGEEMSLSAILGDMQTFRATQQSKKAKEASKMDPTLKKLPDNVKVVKAKRGHHVSHCNIRYGFAEHQGQRLTMEDFVAIVPKLPQPNTFFAAIFDGHGGDLVSRELKARFHKVLSAQADFSSAAVAGSGATQKGGPVPEDLSQFGESSSLPSALRRACLALDRAMLHYAAIQLQEIDAKVGKGEQGKALFRTKGGGPGSAAADAYRKAGSTAVVCLVRGGGAKTNSVLTVAWVGDSRAVLCRGGTPVELSKDHKASRDDEKARIRAAGGTVDRQGRLYGDLAVSRAFGDLQHKGREIREILKAGPTAKDRMDEEYGSEGTLICTPDTVQVIVQPSDEFVVLASDGVWDVMTNEQVCAFVRYHLHQHGDVRKAAAELVDKALLMGSVDNVSAVVVGFLMSSSSSSAA